MHLPNPMKTTLTERWTAIEGWEITYGNNVLGGSHKWVVRTHKEKREALETLDAKGEWYRIREIPKGK